VVAVTGLGGICGAVGLVSGLEALMGVYVGRAAYPSYVGLEQASLICGLIA